MAGRVRISTFYTTVLRLTGRSDERTKQSVVVKSAPNFLFRNEREILKHFQNTRSLRRIIDEIQDSPLLVLEHLDSYLLVEAATRKLESSDIKLVAKAVLQVLAAFHEKGIVHTVRETHGQHIITF